MTSANTTYYRICKNGEEVGSFSQSCYCKTRWHELLKYEPLELHTIQAYGEDEEEAGWEDPPMKLRQFLLNHRAIARLPSDPPEFITFQLYGKDHVAPYCCDGKISVKTITNAEIMNGIKIVSETVEDFYCSNCKRDLPIFPPELPVITTFQLNGKKWSVPFCCDGNVHLSLSGSSLEVVDINDTTAKANCVYCKRELPVTEIG